MPKKILREEKLNIIKARVDSSERIMKEEKDKYWKPCRDFYDGKHWPEELENKIATINLIWATVKTQLASQYFRNPEFSLKPLKEEFGGPIQRLHEAILRYHAKKALLKLIARNTVQATFTDLGIMTWGCDTKFTDGYAQEDSFYFKRIRPEDFLVDHTSGIQIFEKLPWFAESEYMRKEEVARKWNIKLDDISPSESTGDIDEEYEKQQRMGFTSPEVTEDMKRVKVYRFYDREEGKLYIYGKGHDEFWDIEDYTDPEPYAVLKYDERSTGFYPNPEIWHLIDSQKQIEIAASMLSEHMKRSARKLAAQKGMVDPENMKKLESAATGVVVETDKPPAGTFAPIDMGQADSSIYNHAGMQQGYFDQIAGVNIAKRGGADQKKQTATAEAIIDKYAMNRSSDRMSTLSDFMAKVGKGFLDCLQKNLSVPGVIKIADEQGGQIWASYIPSIDIVGDYECEVRIGETAPKDDALERQQFVGMLEVLQKSPMVMMSPTLIEELLQRFNIDSPRLKDEIKKMGQMWMMLQMGVKPGQGGDGAPVNMGQMAGRNLAMKG